MYWISASPAGRLSAVACPAVRIFKGAVIAASRIFHLNPSKASAVLITFTSTRALPGICADVVMISTRRQKNCLVAIGLHGIKAQLLMPESFGILCIAHAQVDMTNDGILWRTVPFTALTIDHLVAQKLGRQQWYETYRVRIARVERAYGFDAKTT